MVCSNTCKIRGWYTYHHSAITSINFGLLMFAAIPFYVHMPPDMGLFCQKLQTFKYLVHIYKW